MDTMPSGFQAVPGDIQGLLRALKVMD